MSHSCLDCGCLPCQKILTADPLAVLQIQDFERTTATKNIRAPSHDIADARYVEDHEAAKPSRVFCCHRRKIQRTAAFHAKLKIIALTAFQNKRHIGCILEPFGPDAPAQVQFLQLRLHHVPHLRGPTGAAHRFHEGRRVGQNQLLDDAVPAKEQRESLPRPKPPIPQV